MYIDSLEYEIAHNNFRDVCWHVSYFHESQFDGGSLPVIWHPISFVSICYLAIQYVTTVSTQPSCRWFILFPFSEPIKLSQRKHRSGWNRQSNSILTALSADRLSEISIQHLKYHIEFRKSSKKEKKYLENKITSCHALMNNYDSWLIQ